MMQMLVYGILGMLKRLTWFWNRNNKCSKAFIATRGANILNFSNQSHRYFLASLTLLLICVFSVTEATATVDVQPLNVTRGSSSVVAGGSLSVSWQIRNNGTTSASTSNSQVRITASNTASGYGSSSNNVGVAQPTGTIGAGVTINQSTTVTVPTTPATYYVWIIADNNSNLTQTNVSNDYAVSAAVTVTAVTPTPTVSSISPTTMTANNTSQQLTISGGSFQSGNIVQFKWGVGTGAGVWTTSNNTPTINSSSQITSSMNPGAVNDTIYVRVCSTSSATACSSGTQAVTVTAVTPTPTVSSISPTTMTANNTSQQLTISGGSFQSGNIVQFKWGVGTGAGVWTTSNNTPTINSSSQITSSMNPGAVNDTIYVRVCSTSSATACSSGTQAVTVTAVTPTPTVSSISPTAMTANGTNQQLTIYGGSFQSGNIVQFKWGVGTGAGVWTTSNNTPTINSSSQITSSMNPGAVNDTIYVRVCSTSSATACSLGTQAVTVTATAAAPLTAPTLTSPGEAVNNTHTAIPYSSITFSWNKNNTGASFNLYVRDITGLADDVAITSGSLVINNQNVGDVSSYTWTGAQVGKKYRWQVEAVKSGYATVISNKLVFVTYGGSFLNDSFEQGELGWVRTGAFNISTDKINFPYPHSNSGYAWFAKTDGTGGDNLNGSLNQTFIVPSAANIVTLSFWYNITSQETANFAKDVLTVMILDAAGAPLPLVKTFSNLDKQATLGDYRQVSFDLTPYRGQTIQLKFIGTTDGYAPTVFRIDDVSINASLSLPTISGSVTYNGTGLTGVSLGLSDGATSTATTTDATGGYNFPNLNNATYSIVPARSGYTFNPSSRQPSVAGVNLQEQNFRACYDALSLSGALIDKTTGSSLPGVTVTVDGVPRVTDSNGVYTFPGLNCGINHNVSVTAAGYQAYNYSVDISATPVLAINLTKTATVYGPQADSGYAADPVNTATGNYIYQRKDLEIPGRGLPFAFERNYNSQAAAKDGADGSLGFGWTHSYDIRLDVADASPGTITHGDGRTETWKPDGLGGYTPQYGVFDTLLNNGDGTYTLKKKDLTRYNFDASGRLASITDKNRNSVGLTYTGSNLTRVTDTVGREIVLAYNASNRITTITDPINRTVQFTYDGNGNLVTATDMNGNATTYTYDASHQMLTVVDPRGNTVVSNVYDEQKRVVNSQRDAKLGQTTYLYNESTRETVITDQLNNNTYHYHDELLRLIQEKDPRGNSTYYTYDADGNRTVVKDKNGKTTTYAYDANGNVTSKTDPLNNVTTITYDANNNPLSRTDALGKTTTFEYDSNGNLNKTIDPLGHLSAITYNGNGQPLTVIDPRGNTATNVYDGQGNLLEVADPLGNKTSFTYDGAGRRLTATDALARVSAYVYDNNNNLLSATDPLGNVVSSSYDGNNNRLTATDAKGNATTFAYDVKDLLVTTTDPLGKTMTITYDPLDRKTAVTDKLGNSTSFTYDAVGNLLAAIDPLGNTINSTYDANGNKLTASDPLGHQTTFIYDVLNRVIGARDSLGNIATTSYDQAGRVVATTNAKGQTTAFEYDALGRLTKVTDANNGTVTYSYDANGNRLAMTDPNGNTTTYAYDALNRLVTKTESLGVPYRYVYEAVGNMTSMTDPKGQTTTYAYDVLNRLQSVTYPDSSTVTYSYDANANRTAMTDSLGTSRYQYDILNRLTGYTDPFNKTVGYGYDANGNRVTLTYPDGKIVTYGYDAASRLTSVKDWGNRTTAYAYDDAGKLTTTTNANGTVAAYAYDNAGRLIGLINSKADSTVISSYSYTLDAIGNHLQVEQKELLLPGIPAEDTSYTYDADNRVTSAGAVANTFDANGNLIAKGSDTYTYDSNDRLIASTIGGVVSQYNYDGQGNRLAKASGGMTTRYALDINGKLANVLAETDGSGAITAYYVYGLGLISKVLPGGTATSYHYDSRGSTIALTDAGQNVTDAYAYDTFGSVVNSNGLSQNTFRYVGKFGLMDEGNGLVYVRARYYSPGLGRFITKDPLTGKDGDSQSLNRYVYALNNSLRFVDVNGLTTKDIVISVSLDKIEKAGNYIYNNTFINTEFVYKNLSINAHDLGWALKEGAKTVDNILTFKTLFEESEKELGRNITLSEVYEQSKAIYELTKFGIHNKEIIKDMIPDIMDSTANSLFSVAAITFNTACSEGTFNIVDCNFTGKNIRGAIDKQLMPVSNVYYGDNKPFIAETYETNSYTNKSFKK